MKYTVQEMPAGEFKAKCLKLMEEVNLKQSSIVITKHGVPIAKLIPYDDAPISLYGILANSVKVHGDIVESTGEKWEVDSE